MKLHNQNGDFFNIASSKFSPYFYLWGPVLKELNWSFYSVRPNKQHWFPFVWFCIFRTIWLYLKCFKCNRNIVFHVINLLTTVQGMNCFKYTSKLAESLDAYLDIFLTWSLFGYCILTCWTILYLTWKLVEREWYSKAVVTMSVTCVVLFIRLFLLWLIAETGPWQSQPAQV